MTITDTLILPDGTAEVRETEVADNYFDPPTAPPPTAEEKLRADIDYLAMVTGVTLDV